MVEIKITQKQENFNDIGFLKRIYELDTTIKINEDSTISEFMGAVVKAMKIEGYRVSESAMLQAIDDLVAECEIEPTEKN